MKRLLALLLLSCAGLEAQTATPINENNLPSTSTLSDSDSVRVIQNGQSKKTPASVVRSIRAAQINDASGVGRNWVTTATPAAISYPRINADGTISYLDATHFWRRSAPVHRASAFVKIDGAPDIAFNVLEVPDDSLTDIGGGVARLTFSTTTGGGGGRNTGDRSQGLCQPD